MFADYSNKINIQKLKDSFDIIKDEYLSLNPSDFVDYPGVRNGMEDMITNPINTGYFWQIYPLIYQRKLWPNRKIKTSEILMDLGVVPIISAFSNLSPYSQIDPHEDHDEHKVDEPSTTVIKYHLTLTTPNDGECALIVGDEKRILYPGSLNAFDESSTHWVYNQGSSVRSALIISFLKKDLE